jgi:ribose transport system permease protein
MNDDPAKLAGSSHANAADSQSNPVASDSTSPGSGRRRTIQDVIARFGVFGVLIILVVAFCIALPDSFATTGNLKIIVNSSAIVMILALAATIPLRAGNFDLSIAGTLVTSAGLTALLTSHGSGWVVALLVGIGVGVVVGLVNGSLIVGLGLDGFITTLGSYTALTGIALGIANGQLLTGVDHSVIKIATTNLLGIQTMTWIGWGIALVMWYVFDRTPVGRYLLFVGGSPDAARLAGLPVMRIRILTFVWAGALSGIAGFLLAGSLGSVDVTTAGQYLLQPYAAAFLGATTIAVGRFNALGTVVGLYLLIVGITGLQLLGAAEWITSFFDGLALIVAITFARLAARCRAT